MASTESDLIVARPEGLYCPAGDFFIDPWRPVDRAVITHGHSDHARVGPCALPGAHRTARARCASAWAPTSTCRRWTTARSIEHHGVRAVAAPGRPCAGLGAGAAGARRPGVGGLGRLQDRGRRHLRALRAGALRHLHHRIAPSACRSTAGPRRPVLFADINAWWRAMPSEGRASVLLCYAFGKAQRMLHGVDASIGPIVVHGAVEPLNAVYRAAGVAAAADPPRDRARTTSRDCSSARWCWHRPRPRARRG